MPLTPAQFIAKGHGKTAPWADLVNSEEWDTYGKRTDWLADPSWLPFFLRRWGFAGPGRSRFPATQFLELRKALRKCCEALFSGRQMAPSELRVLNRALGVPGTRALIVSPSGLDVAFVPQTKEKDWDWILAQIALSFAELAASANSERIKICRNNDCRWVFYDASKAKSRRWCSDKVCGNRERVRRARARACS